MMKLYYILILTLILGCSESKLNFKSNWQNVDLLSLNSAQSDTLSIRSNKFESSDLRINLSIFIEYPQIVNYYNERHQNAFNRLIKNQIYEMIKTYKIGLKSDSSSKIVANINYVKGSYQIYYKSKNSISFTFNTKYKYSYDTTLFEHTQSINYNLSSASVINLSDLFPNDTNYLNLISKEAHRVIVTNKKIDKDWVNNGLTPVLDNFKNFNIKNKKLIIFLDKYQIDPKSKQSSKIEIPFEYFPNFKDKIQLIFN